MLGEACGKRDFAERVSDAIAPAILSSGAPPGRHPPLSIVRLSRRLLRLVSSNSRRAFSARPSPKNSSVQERLVPLLRVRFVWTYGGLLLFAEFIVPLTLSPLAPRQSERAHREGRTNEH